MADEQDHSDYSSGDLHHEEESDKEQAVPGLAGMIAQISA